MLKRMIIMLCVIGTVFAALAWFVNFRAGKISQAMASLADPPQTVSTTAAQFSDWQSSLTAIGTFHAVNGADLSLQQPGIVDSIHFESGKEVAAGDALLDLRNEDDVAKLQSLQATADGYGITLRRDQGQLKINAVSQATVDSDAVNERNALALVAQQQALVDKKTLRAPFRRPSRHAPGRPRPVSRRRHRDRHAAGARSDLRRLHAAAAGDAQIKVGQEVVAQGRYLSGPQFTGKIAAINSKVDTASRNVQVRATCRTMRTVSCCPACSRRSTSTIGAPQQLRHAAADGDRLQSLRQPGLHRRRQGQRCRGKPQLVARQTFVTTGATRGDQVAVLKGVKDGDMVVTAGQIKLRNGAPLIVNNTVAPPNDPNPKPADQ